MSDRLSHNASTIGALWTILRDTSVSDSSNAMSRKMSRMRVLEESTCSEACAVWDGANIHTEELAGLNLFQSLHIT